MSGTGPLVPVAVVPDAVLAGMYEELLRREGIRAMAQPQGPGYGAWGSVTNLPHRLLVTANLAETARSLIEEHFGDEYLVSPDGS